MASAGRTLAEVMEEVNDRLASMEVSCQEAIGASATGEAQKPRILTPRRSQMELLQLQVAQLKAQLALAVARREAREHELKQTAAFVMAKGSANAVLRALFDLVKNANLKALATWLDSGNVNSRDGFLHWRPDLRELRDENGATVLHVAVDASMKPEKVKLKLVGLLLDRVQFDPNVRDLFGRTPLHTAAISGFPQIVKLLLDNGCDPLAQDHCGLTALSFARTWSRPREEVVKILTQAENAAAKNASSPSSLISPTKAISSALFLRSLLRLVLPPRAAEFAKQTTSLLSALLRVKSEQAVSFDVYVREYVPILFEPLPSYRVARLDQLLVESAFQDLQLIDELRIEADGYGISLVAPVPVSSSLNGATWTSVLLKMVHQLKLLLPDIWSVSPTQVFESGPDSVNSSSASETSSQHLGFYVDPQSVQSRQAWHYVVLFKAATMELPGTVSLNKDADVAVSSQDLSKFFPLGSSLIIGSEEFFAIGYSRSTREIKLDRTYKGSNLVNVKVCVQKVGSDILPPYIAVKKIWEREPGNKFEVHMSNEQELFQDYQFVQPNSDYEVAVKLGPLLTTKDAKEVANEWKQRSKELFVTKTCMSASLSCNHDCPQRHGHSMCLGTMIAVGQELAKKYLGSAMLAKTLKPRASVQKLESRFKTIGSWP